jgi:superfamily I DNA/RNA helicase
VVEVKEGNIQYSNGQWQEFKNGRYSPLSKDPLKQARDSMFAIIHRYKEVSKSDYPLRFRYALCFPDTTRKVGMTPEDLHEDSCWTASDLENLEEALKKLFSRTDNRNPIEATKQLITKVLSPTFRLFSTLDDQFEKLHNQAEIILTEEQERILEETEEDHRKIFFGAAGTGKTFIAMKKALLLAEEGKKVLLTCYNKHLVTVFNKFASHENVMRMNFHDYLYQTIENNGYELDDPEDWNEFYGETLPNMMYDLYSLKENDEKFDAILVDEGQDFKENWYLCLDQMLKENGHFYIFADRHQNLFGNGLDSLKDFQMSKHKLTINLRNTQRINEWCQPLIGTNKLRYRISGGQPVEYFAWKDYAEERRHLEHELNILISQGLSPLKVTILSTHRNEKSSLKHLNHIGSGEWPIVELGKSSGYGIKFSTIRAFKGLESDVVFIIGLKKDSPVSTPTDIYVGGTRARFLLKIFHHEDWAIGDVSKY